MKFRILYDNRADELEAAWGFSCLIEIENGKNILFDTGGNAKNPGRRVYVLKSFSSNLKSEINEIGEGIFTTGELGSRIKEQSLIVDNTVVTGCAHPGLVEIAGKAKETVGEISSVFGGFHLMDSSENEISETISDLKRLGVNNGHHPVSAGKIF